MLKPTTSLLALTFVSVGLTACSDDPPSPSSVRSRITSDLGYVLAESAAAGESAQDALPMGSIDLFQKALGQGGSTAIASLLPEDPVEPDGLDTQAIIDRLNQQVFTDANEVEPGIYAVPASLACETTDFDQNGNPITSIDPDCAASWDKVGLRIRVSENSSTLTFAIQLGAAHDEPLEIGLTHNSIKVSVDLDEAEAAAQALASAFGQMAPNADLAGKVTGTLTVLGTAHAKVSLDIDRALAIAVAEDGVALTSPDAFRMTSAAAHVIDVELDGVAKSGTAALGLGATTVHVPGEDTFDLDLPGATATASLAQGQPLSISNISLGDRTTTLSKNGAVGLAIDLNPQDGRKLDATITSDATGETVSVSPKLDARIQTNHAALGDTAGVYDVTRVLLDGSLHGSDASDQVKVLTGSFAISTNPAQYGFTAAAGQCVAGTEEYDTTLDEYYTAWTVGACQ